MNLIVYPTLSIARDHAHRLSEAKLVEKINHCSMQITIAGEVWLQRQVRCQQDLELLFGWRFDKIVIHYSCEHHWTLGTEDEYVAVLKSINRPVLNFSWLEEHPENPWHFKNES